MPEKLRKGWARVAFGDVVRLVRERSADPKADGLDRYVGLEHLEPGDSRIRRWGDVAVGTTFTNVFRVGQVLFGKRRAYQRKVAVANFDGVCSGDIYVLEPKSERLVPGLLSFICQTDGFFEHAVGTSAGSLSPRTNWGSLAAYEFALPPPEEQRRIAGLLSVIKACAESVSTALDEAERLFDSLRIYAFEDRSFPQLPLEQMAEVTMGRQRAPQYQHGANMVPYLRAANVKDGTFDLTSVLTMDFTPAEQQVYALEPGDVLVTEGCGSLSQIGANAVWQRELPGTVCLQNTLLRLRARQGVSPTFIKHWARYAFKRGSFARAASGTNVFHIGSTRAKKMLVPLASLEVQLNIAEQLNALETAVGILQRRKRVLGELMKAASGTLLSESTL